MAAPTLTELQTIMTTLLGDAAITTTDEKNALNAAILEVRGEMLVTATTTTPSAAATVSVPAGFVYVYAIEDDGEPLPDASWRIREDATTPTIVFDINYFNTAPAGTLTISGGTFQAVLSSSGDSLYIDSGYIMGRALAMCHSLRGGTESGFSTWHKQMADWYQQFCERRYPQAIANFGPPSGARLVRGRLTV